MKRLLLPLLLGSLLSSCVKDPGALAPGNSSTQSGGTSGGSSGSSSGGATSNTDPLVGEAWHLNNTGQNAYSESGGVAAEDSSVTDAFNLGYTGSGVRIAISDSGTDTNHEDLYGNALSGEHRNYAISSPDLWRESDPVVSHSGDEETDAHGTAVAGLIAAMSLNGVGSRGVAPKAKFAAFKYIVKYPETVTSASLLARSIDQSDGNFDIFNYSYGYPQCVFTEEDSEALDAIKVGAKNLRNGKGAIYVQSAGNNSTGTYENCLGLISTSKYVGNANMSDDLTLPEKIVVGAVNATGEISSYSSPGSNIWVSAPGGEFGTDSPAMVTTDISGCSHGFSKIYFYFNDFNRGLTDNKYCNYTSYMNGTSSAAPVTSGVVALMLQANPSLTWRDVKHILAMTADQVDSNLPSIDTLTHPLSATYDLAGHDYDYKWIENGAGIPFSNRYGFGRVNAHKAVLLAKSYNFPLGTYAQTLTPLNGTWYYDSGTIAQAIPDASATGATSSLSVLHNFYVESVQVQITMTHSNPSDLGISLLSPSGKESKLIMINNGVYAAIFPANKMFLTNAFYNETSYGTWKLKVVDGKTGTTGTLTNWKLLINGHKFDGDGSNPNPVTSLALAAPVSSTVSPVANFTASTSTDVARYEASVGSTSGGTNVMGWTSIGTTTSAIKFTGLTLTHGTNFYLNIRAVDKQENVSTTLSAVWTAP